MTDGTTGGPGTVGPEIADEPCAFCGGSGRDLVSGDPCFVCRGVGKNPVMRPLKTCPHCNGSGKAFMKVGVPCPSCGGTGFTTPVRRT